MSITLSATIAETRLGHGTGGVMAHHSSSDSKERYDPATGRKKNFEQHQSLKPHMDLDKPPQFRLVCQIKMEEDTKKK